VARALRARCAAGCARAACAVRMFDRRACVALRSCHDLSPPLPRPVLQPHPSCCHAGAPVLARSTWARG
jgi:hypothetical protein